MDIPKLKISIVISLIAIMTSLPVVSQTSNAPANEIKKCELSGTLSQNIRGRVTLYDNDEFIAWFFLNHRVTEGNAGGLRTRTSHIPFLGLELRIDNDGSNVS